MHEKESLFPHMRITTVKKEGGARYLLQLLLLLCRLGTTPVYLRLKEGQRVAGGGGGHHDPAATVDDLTRDALLAPTSEGAVESNGLIEGESF